MNSVGPTDAALAVVPAEQRLDARRPDRRRVDDGLVEQHELVALQGALEVALQRQPRQRGRRACSARTPRCGSCRWSWPCTSRRPRCGAARRPSGPATCGWRPRRWRRTNSSFPPWIERRLELRRAAAGRRPSVRLAVDRVLDEDGELVAAHPGDRVARRGRTLRSRSATATRSRSPSLWPRLSLTVLKSSRSTNSTASGRRTRVRSARSRARGDRRTAPGWPARSASRGTPGDAARPRGPCAR